MQYIKTLIKNRKHLKTSMVIWLLLSTLLFLKFWVNSEVFDNVILPLSIIRGLRYAFLYWFFAPAVIKFWESGKLLD